MQSYVTKVFLYVFPTNMRKYCCSWVIKAMFKTANLVVKYLCSKFQIILTLVKTLYTSQVKPDMTGFVNFGTLHAKKLKKYNILMMASCTMLSGFGRSLL